jgi:hypothetical protein
MRSALNGYLPQTALANLQAMRATENLRRESLSECVRVDWTILKGYYSSYPHIGIHKALKRIPEKYLSSDTVVGRLHPFIGHEGLGTRRGWGVSVTPQPHLNPGKDPVLTVQEAGWASGSVWTGAENLAHTGIRSPGRPARRQSLYRLRYPAHGYRSFPLKYHI